MKTGIDLIAEERQRQIEVEGWDYNQDDNYKRGEMMGAAGCYVANALSKHLEDYNHTNQSPLAHFEIYSFNTTKEEKSGWIDAWPWDKKWDKRWKHDKMRSLVIAGALIAAEIDRLQKQSKPMKVFKFYSEDNYWAYSGETEEAAKAALIEDEGEIDIDKTEEIPESQWDDKIINIWEDNDFEKEPFKSSIREQMFGHNKPQLIFTSDVSSF